MRMQSDWDRQISRTEAVRRKRKSHTRKMWGWNPEVKLTVYSGTSASTTSSHKLSPHPKNFSRITQKLKVVSVQATIPLLVLERAQEKFWTQHSFLRLSVPLESARSFEQVLGQRRKKKKGDIRLLSSGQFVILSNRLNGCYIEVGDI